MNAKLQMILSMLIFGTVGIFVKFIDMPTGFIAAVRGGVGAIMIALFMLITKKKPDFREIVKKLPLIILSGAAMGFNWILLFESYRYTSVAVATTCYYMAPIFVVIASPFVLKEKLSVKSVACVAVALFGSALVSGIIGSDAPSFAGVLLALGAALLYATVMLTNKFLGNLSAYERTTAQLLVAGVTVLPYACVVGGKATFTPVTLVCLSVVALVHTGIAYTLYFGATTKLSAKTIAVLSYIDPASAILLSALILREKISLPEIIGAILIIGAAFVSETKFKKGQSK